MQRPDNRNGDRARPSKQRPSKNSKHKTGASGHIVSPGRKNKPGIKENIQSSLKLSSVKPASPRTGIVQAFERRILPPSARRVLYVQIQRQVLAGIPLAAGLKSLSDMAGGRTGRALKAMAQKLDDGDTLLQASMAAPCLFSKSAATMLGMAEKTGQIPATLDALVRKAELERDVRRSFLRALVYPCFLIVAASFLLPLPKLITCGPSTFFTGMLSIQLPALGIAAAFVGTRFLLFNERIHRAAVTASSKIPFINGIQRDRALATSLQAMGLALESGLGLPEAMNLAISVADSSEIESIWKRTSELTGTGAGLAESLDPNLPDDLAVAIANGEKTGNLAESLKESAETSFSSYSDRMKMIERTVSGLILTLVLTVMAVSIVRSFMDVLNINSAGDFDPEILKEIPGIFQPL